MIQNLIQERVDALASSLQRSVAVDDVSILLVAASRHFDDADAPRIRALLERRLDKESTEYLLDFGIATTQEPLVRIPAHDALSIQERVCFPIRGSQENLGYVWLIGDTTAEEEEAAKACASDLGVLLFGMQLENEKAHLQREATIRDLFSINAQRVARATYLLQKQGLLSPLAEYRVLYIISQTQDVQALTHEYDTLKRRLNEMAARSACECHPLFTQMATDLLVVLPACCEEILSLPRMMMPPHMYVGVGKRVDMQHCCDSYTQAFSIVQILRSIPTLGNVAAWEDLGVYSYLALVFSEKYRSEAGEVIPLPNVNKLLKENEELLPTLEVFLDNAGSIAESARALCIHRSSLYYRLKRIEDVTGMSLGSGLHRLHLHLECKFWRLSRWQLSTQP